MRGSCLLSGRLMDSIDLSIDQSHRSREQSEEALTALIQYAKYACKQSPPTKRQ